MVKQFFLTLIIFVSLPTIAASNQSALHEFYGTWKLVSITRQSLSGKQFDDYGKNPVGYLNYSPNGRMITIIVKENRKKPANKTITSIEAKALLSSMTSYAGTYTIKDNQIIHHIDVSWNQSWTGTDQVRFYKFEGKYLLLAMPVFIDPKDGKTKIVLKWKKV